MKSFNLRQLKLRSGEQYRDEIELDLAPFELGGERYLPVPGTVPADLEITKAATGTVFQLAFTARLHGPCYRCMYPEPPDPGSVPSCAVAPETTSITSVPGR